MKRSVVIICAFLLAAMVSAQDSTKRFVIPIRDWEMKIAGLDNFYPTYLADPLGIRFEVSSQRILYGDFEFADPINKEGRYLNKLVINPGVRISL